METLMPHNPSHRSSLCSFHYLRRDSIISHFLLISTSIFLVILSCLVFLDAFGVFQLHPLLRLGYLSFSSMPKQSAVVEEGCDYSNGRWVYDEDYQGLHYKEDCPFLDPGFRCQQNGRKDLDYQKWRWQPFGCDLPKFNARDFLERSRHGRLVFAGDSIGRNQWESLICMLSQAVSNSSAIYEINGNPITKHKGYLAIKFEEFNCSIEYYRDPYLVAVGRPPKNSSEEIQRAVRVDHLHWFSTKWRNSDVLVFNAGHWWTADKTKNQGTFFQEGGAVNMTMDTKSAFKKSLQTWKHWVFQKLDLQKSYVFFRSYSSVHFNGTWNEGGTCHDNSQPQTNSTKLEAEPWHNEIIHDTIKQMKHVSENVKFLNITYLTEFRNDGHPSLHREPGTPEPIIEDCSHWCLPGVPDAWNEILYAHLLSSGYRIRRQRDEGRLNV
ncbi:trichome birefringence-like 9 protein [Nymphaea thermarum]|nr:trichome birefringence-like 9 protein [Nymphaea thermarum]